MASPVARARARRAAAAIALTALASALATVRIWYYGRAVALPARAMGPEGGVTPRGGVVAAPCPATAEMSGRSYVFVLGLHSCGTSLLHAALTSAPGASALEARGDAAPMGEGEDLQTVLPRGGALAARAGERRAWAFPLNREAFIRCAAGQSCACFLGFFIVSPTREFDVVSGGRGCCLQSGALDICTGDVKILSRRPLL